MDYEDFNYRSRLDSAKEAITRVRFSFLANVVASLTVALAIWNGYFSWYRYFVLVPHCSGCTVEDPTRIAQEQVIKSWVSSLIVNIAPLGITFGVSDLAFIGSTGLMILSVMFVYCARKENHAISYLLIDTQRKPRELREALYYGISSHLVFLSVNRDDRPITELRVPHDGKRSRMLWLAFDLLAFAPVITIGIIIFADLMSVFVLHGPFRQSHSVLWHAMIPAEKRQFFLMETVPAILGLVTFMLCNSARLYSQATVSILRQYSIDLRGLTAGTEGERVCCDADISDHEQGILVGIGAMNSDHRF